MIFMSLHVENGPKISPSKYSVENIAECLKLLKISSI